MTRLPRSRTTSSRASARSRLRSRQRKLLSCAPTSDRCDAAAGLHPAAPIPRIEWMTNVNAAVLLSLALGGIPTCGMGADEVTRTWHFTALLDGKPIGTHDFAVVRQADGVTGGSVAHFKVRVAFITAYVYEHQDHEVWRGGCLTYISSETNDNGHKVAGEGALEGDGFEVRSSRGATRLPACVRT